MKYGEYPVYDALGVELTHPVKCRDATLKKGHVLTSQDIGRLKYAGIKTVVGARFSSNDVPPETTADILLKTMVGDYLRYTLPDESGYCEIFADIDGVFVFDPDRLKRLNTHCEDFAVMTVRPYLPVYKGQFVANLRLFSPAVDADVLNQAVTKISGTGALFKIAPYAFCKIGYIRTVATGTTPEQIDDDALEKRFAAYGFSIVHSAMCAHDSESVEKAVRDALDARAEIVLVESPFPPLNRDDTVPKAFKEAAADIDRLGWCVDAGVPLVLGHKGGARLLGFCADDAEQPALDVLTRFLATKSLPPIDMLPMFAMNGISLLRMTKKITAEQLENSVSVGAVSDSEKIAVVILAAGASRRMIGSNKLLEPLDGLPMIERVVRSVLSSKADYVVVVTGHDAMFIERRLEKYDVKIVRNPDYVSGVLGSIRLGLAVLPPDIAGAVILPADMPAFTEEYINRLIDAFDAKAERPPVVVPTFNGVRHNPVLWPRNLFKVAKPVPEDAHWTPALIEHTDYIREIPLKDDLPLTDINTHGDLSNYKARAELVSDAEQDLLALERGK